MRGCASRAIFRADLDPGVVPVPQIWIDGTFYPQEQAKVSVFDHGLLYGDGVFEGIRAYNGRIFRLKPHLDRLYASAKAIWLEVPLARDQMARLCEECIRVNNLTDAYIRLLVTRGFGDLGLDPRKCAKASVICIADKIALFPAGVYERGLTMMTAPTPVNHREGLSPRVKSLNYLAHILAKIEAIHAGVDEALMLESTGEVAEGVGENVFCVFNHTLRTPPAYAGILRGVTRDAVIELARGAGYEVREESLNRYDLYTADEVFLTGTAAEVVGVVKLDGRKIGCGTVGQVTKDLAARFRELVSRDS
jgi:branched-chain amino acid aminotransferase